MVNGLHFKGFSGQRDHSKCCTLQVSIPIHTRIHAVGVAATFAGATCQSELAAIQFRVQCVAQGHFNT